jgi:hypothetical protein
MPCGSVSHSPQSASPSRVAMIGPRSADTRSRTWLNAAGSARRAMRPLPGDNSVLDSANAVDFASHQIA